MPTNVNWTPQISIILIIPIPVATIVKELCDNFFFVVVNIFFLECHWYFINLFLKLHYRWCLCYNIIDNYHQLNGSFPDLQGKYLASLRAMMYQRLTPFGIRELNICDNVESYIFPLDVWYLCRYLSMLS